VDGMSIEGAASFGNILAARVVQHRGAIVDKETMTDISVSFVV
jgi:sugar/nucleoside kinase (ribokinase family)